MNIANDRLLHRLEQGVKTETTGETIRIAQDLAAFIPENQIIALHGDLGTGKTTFIKGLARAWKISEPVTSPTFNLYTLHQGIRQLIHLDAYRLSSGADLDALMIDDFLSPPWCLAIEWAERILEELPENAWHLYLSIDSDKKHCIRLKI